MRVLLDTRCWLWMHTERFNASALQAILDPANLLFFSAASAWEIAIKCSLGKLALPVPPEDYVPSRMLRVDTAVLPITHDHALRVASLPCHHRDLFDRLLVAQCQAEGMKLLTADRQFSPYEIEVIWAS